VGLFITDPIPPWFSPTKVPSPFPNTLLPPFSGFLSLFLFGRYRQKAPQAENATLQLYFVRAVSTALIKEV
jgi:hypothetical protein